MVSNQRTTCWEDERSEFGLDDTTRKSRSNKMHDAPGTLDGERCSFFESIEGTVSKTQLGWIADCTYHCRLTESRHVVGSYDNVGETMLLVTDFDFPP